MGAQSRDAGNSLCIIIGCDNAKGCIFGDILICQSAGMQGDPTRNCHFRNVSQNRGLTENINFCRSPGNQTQFTHRSIPTANDDDCFAFQAPKGRKHVHDTVAFVAG
jgi:hypothetical protein